MLDTIIFEEKEEEEEAYNGIIIGDETSKVCRHSPWCNTVHTSMWGHLTCKRLHNNNN